MSITLLLTRARPGVPTQVQVAAASACRALGSPAGEDAGPAPKGRAHGISTWCDPGWLGMSMP